MITDEEAAAIEARAKAATEGAWCWDEDLVELGGYDTEGVPDEVLTAQSPVDPDDAAFIAHARADVPALLADRRERIEREAQIQATLAQAREALAALFACHTGPLGPEGAREPCPHREGLLRSDCGLCDDDACHAAHAALALPQDRTARDAALAEARRQGASEAAGRCVAAAQRASERHEPAIGRYVGPKGVAAAVETEAARIEAGDEGRCAADGKEPA